MVSQGVWQIKYFKKIQVFRNKSLFSRNFVFIKKRFKGTFLSYSYSVSIFQDFLLQRWTGYTRCAKVKRIFGTRALGKS